MDDYTSVTAPATTVHSSWCSLFEEEDTNAVLAQVESVEIGEDSWGNKEVLQCILFLCKGFHVALS